MSSNRIVLVAACLAATLGLGSGAEPDKAPKVSTKKALAQRDALFAKPQVVEVSIDLDKDALAALRRAPRSYAKATIKVGGTTYKDVGVHVKGAAGSFRGIDDKPGLTINMDKFGNPALFHGMDKWHLANSVQDGSYLSELICGELFRAAGVPASRVSHATVTINGRKRGAYYLKEGYDKYFLRQHFGDSDGNFYDGGFLRDVDQPLQLLRNRTGPKDHSDLKALVAAAREPKAALRLEKLGRVLDLDRFISYLALESATWDWDGYPMNRNNYRIYHDEKTKKFVFLPSGMDQMFGHPGGPILPDFQGFVARAVIDTPEGRRRFYVRLAEIRADVLDVPRVTKRLDEVQAAFQPALAAVDAGAGRDYPNQVKRLKSAIAERAAAIDRQLKGKLGDRWVQFVPPGEFEGGKELTLKTIRFFPSKADAKATGKFFWRRKGDKDFASLPLEPAGKDRYSARLPASVTKDEFEYYVELSEGGDKTATEPADGPKSPRLATPDLTPPTAVGDLAASAAKSYRVALGWKAATDDRQVVGYRVYRGTADGFATDDKSRLAKLSPDALAYTDSAPTPKKTAWYAVRAVDVVGREGAAKYLKVDVPDHQPPAHTVAVQARPSVGSVVVGWTGELEPSVSVVEVHRGEGDKGEMRKVAEVTDLKKPHYVDKDVKKGGSYRYALRLRSNVGLAGELGKSVTASPARFLKRINCGGPRIEGEDGIAWEEDTGDGHPSLKYSGSNTWTVGPKVKTDVYQSERWGNRGLGYALKLEPGRYEVAMHFMETNADFAGKGKRTFDVLLDDKVVAEKLDVFTQAGGLDKPYVLRRVVEVKGGELEIKMLANPVGPAIKGVEVIGLPPK